MAYDSNVFINCPFDEEYQPLFRALVFAVYDCGFVPRCALELDDGSEVRIEKIRRIIDQSRYGLHDISRTEPDGGSGLPRFNMPLELGLFLGAKLFGDERQRVKACVIFDRDRYRYQAFCSDIAGQDIRAHHGDEREVVRGVRDALRTWLPGRTLPGAAEVFRRYRLFSDSLEELAARLWMDASELTFNDLAWLVTGWLEENSPPAVRPASAG
ncbi:MAG TPA: hypothetical protein VFQ39_15505 [Longimicrobium sp.]|nr:hypothetical protein [Longimicrobium sp.]